MDSAQEKDHHEHMVVLTAGGDDSEKREMTEVLRNLVAAMEDESLVGCPLLVLEQHCYERLLGLHQKGQAAKAGTGS